MNIGGVRTELERLGHFHQLVLAGCVHPYARTNLTRRAPLARSNVYVAEAGGGGERQREELVLGGKILLAQAFDVLRELMMTRIHPPWLAEREAVTEHRADAGFLQRFDGCVGVRGRLLDMRPVHDRGDAGVERAQRADKIADIDVVW